MPTHTPAQPDASLDLALAVVATSKEPVLLLDGQLNIVAASRSFDRAFDAGAARAQGQSVFALGGGKWNVPQLRSLLTATATGHAQVEAYELDLDASDKGLRHLVMHAEKLDYGDSQAVRLMLTVADVTDARANEKIKDDLLRQKAILLQEVQHRVANSLQIIASVLLQSARQMPSGEARGQLTEAHNRVMSIASVQRQLAASTLGEVKLSAYFEQLCMSLGASMIHDHDLVSIEVRTDDSAVPADTSISLGLIVTELVINALKHAFPDGHSGRIMVDYSAYGPNWTLSVSDDGVGMPVNEDTKPGLGTSIIEALANQLQAEVQVTNAHPGTAVAIVHAKIALVGGAVAH